MPVSLPTPTDHGTIPFPLPVSYRNRTPTTAHTFYKLFGSLTTTAQTPLILLHGGPGSGHEYLIPFTALHTQHDIPMILFDQIGCGASTHYRCVDPNNPSKEDEDFWSMDLFLAELDNLLQYFDLPSRPGGYDVLGHSWGGLLAIAHAARQPTGLHRLILGGPPASGELFFQGLQRLKVQLSGQSQEAINEAIQKGDFTSPAYKKALTEFLRTFLCRAPDPFPPLFLEANFRHQAEDTTLRWVLQGPSPFVYNGTLRRYSSMPLLPCIKVPTLLFNGEFDTAQDESTYPLFEGIEKCKWVTLSGASHMPHLDSEEMLERTLRLVGGFLTR